MEPEIFEDQYGLTRYLHLLDLDIRHVKYIDFRSDMYALVSVLSLDRLYQVVSVLLSNERVVQKEQY